MTSSTHKKQQHMTATAAPPPTPSADHPSTPTNPSSAAAADFLSRLIHRLPPALSIPPWHKASLAATTSVLLPTVAYPEQDTANPSFLGDVLSACTTSGFFQMTGHPVSKELALSAESEMVSLFDLSPEQRRACFPRNWPLGYGNDEDDDKSDAKGELFFLDEACLSYAESESVELELTSLRELMCSIEKVGLEVIGWLSDAIMFENPVEKDQTHILKLAWVSKDSSAGADCSGISETSGSGGLYPFVIGLIYQSRSRKYSLLSDSGPVVVAPQVDSILVTIGDIAQVWSNGRLKKVRGRAISSSDLDGNNNSSANDVITMTLLMTLPLESIVSPLPRKTVVNSDAGDGEGDSGEIGIGSEDDCRAFHLFLFEDYAWRVYHDRLISPKDPLDRYRRHV